LSVTFEANVVEPSLKVTVPLGVCELDTAATVAVNVTLVPKVTGEAGLKVTVVCVELTDGAKIHGSTP
jgi:hypothetical protein